MSSMAHLRGIAEHPRVRLFAPIIAAWGLYVVVVELVARAANPDGGQLVSSDRLGLLHGFVNDPQALPPLARWDSIWFYGVAKDGYSGTRGDSRYAAAFLPLYPFLMRWLGYLVGTDYFTAGIWVSRVSLLAALVLLADPPKGEPSGEFACAHVPAALLAFPSAFLLVSVYSESLFLALALGAFKCLRGERYMGASVCAFAASCTRIQGIALVVGLAVLGWRQSRAGRYSLIRFASAAAGAAAYAAMAAYCRAMFGNPLYHFAVKRAVWRQGPAAPWSVLGDAIDDGFSAMRLDNFGSFYTLLQLPCVYLVLITLVVLYTDRPRNRWGEMAFIGCALVMSLFGGALGGMPRFTLVLFPVFTVAARIRRSPCLWHVYLVLGALLQTCLLVHYIGFRLPPP